MSATLFLEYDDVLNRPELFKAARLDAFERARLFDIFVSKCIFIDVYYKWRPNLRDEGDNHIIELAIAANANVIVTSNLRDFDKSDLRFDQLQIMTPDAVLKELGA